MSTLRLNEDNYVVWRGLRRNYTGAFVNDAIVTAIVRDANGLVVVDRFYLLYEAQSDGDYLGVIDKALTAGLISGAEYFVEVTANIDEDEGEAFRRAGCTAKHHAETP